MSEQSTDRLELPAEPTRAMLEAGEDALADVMRRKVSLGVRCGCPKCDEAAADQVRRVWRAMVSAWLGDGDDEELADG